MTDLTVDEAMSRLAVFQEPCSLCRDEVENTGIATGHAVAGHPAPRRLVHSFTAHAMGADWDEEDVRAFFRHAKRIVELPPEHWASKMGHSVAAQDRDDTMHILAFDTKGA